MTAAVASSPPPVDRPSPDLIRLALTLVLGAIMVTLDMTMVNVALDTLVREFGTSVATIQWVSTGFLLALATVIEHLGEADAARAVEGAIAAALADGPRTPDLGGTATTAEVTAAVIGAL